MASVTVSPSLGDDDPPVGIIDAEDTVTAVLPLDDLIVFIAVDVAARRPLAAALLQLAEAITEEQPA